MSNRAASRGSIQGKFRGALRGSFRGGMLVLLLGSGLMILSALLQTGGSMRFKLSEEVPTDLPPETLKLSTEVVLNWASWHRGVSEARVIDYRGEAYPAIDQLAEPGALVRFTMQPRTEGPTPFLIFRIDRYASNYELKLRLIEDSTASIPSQFDELSWTLSFPSQGTIRLELEAHPITYKARLLCLLAKPLVLANLKLPRIADLASLKQPLSRDLQPQYQR